MRRPSSPRSIRTSERRADAARVVHGQERVRVVTRFRPAEWKAWVAALACSALLLQAVLSSLTPPGALATAAIESLAAHALCFGSGARPGDPDGPAPAPDRTHQGAASSVRFQRSTRPPHLSRQMRQPGGRPWPLRSEDWRRMIARPRASGRPYAQERLRRHNDRPAGPSYFHIRRFARAMPTTFLCAGRPT
jgi:hypothetical protein